MCFCDEAYIGKQEGLVMSPDDIDSFCVDLHSFLINHFDCKIDEDADYELLSDYLHEALDHFCTRDRNYN